MYYIIVNPASKTGKGQKIWTILEKELKNNQVAYQVYFTKAVGDATEFARELTASLTSAITLIVLGGDGTINEVIQGLKNTSLVHIGYIPTGSSNDLARSLKLEKDPVLALHNIFHPKQIKTCDIGKVTYISGTVKETKQPLAEGESVSRLFAVGCGIGFDAAVCEEALDSPIKRTLNHLKLGKLTYLGIALRQILRAPKVSGELYLDDEKPIFLPKFLFIAFMVHRYEGGGFMFCPKADPTDELLDICVAGNLSFIRALRILPTAFSGNHLRFPEVYNFRAKNIKIKTSIPLWVHTDGEVHLISDEIHLTNEKSKLQFIC